MLKKTYPRTSDGREAAMLLSQAFICCVMRSLQQSRPGKLPWAGLGKVPHRGLVRINVLNSLIVDSNRICLCQCGMDFE